MGDLDFLPAWYPRMLRRRRLLAAAAIVMVAAALVEVIALSLWG